MREARVKSDNYTMNNYMEIIVTEMAPKILAASGVCNCESCLLDTMAIALNNLTPKYIVTRKGELYAKLSILHNQFDVDVIAEVSKAAEIVSSNPRHS